MISQLLAKQLSADRMSEKGQLVACADDSPATRNRVIDIDETFSGLEYIGYF